MTSLPLEDDDSLSSIVCRILIPRRTRRTKLGESIRDMMACPSSSESEADSEDEVGGLLGEAYTVVVEKTMWREPR
jgi:hypothetical protein